MPEITPERIVEEWKKTGTEGQPTEEIEMTQADTTKIVTIGWDQNSFVQQIGLKLEIVQAQINWTELDWKKERLKQSGRTGKQECG